MTAHAVSNALYRPPAFHRLLPGEVGRGLFIFSDDDDEHLVLGLEKCASLLKVPSTATPSVSSNRCLRYSANGSPCRKLPRSRMTMMNGDSRETQRSLSVSQAGEGEPEGFMEGRWVVNELRSGITER